MSLTTPGNWDGIPDRSKIVDWSKLQDPSKKAYWEELLGREERVEWGDVDDVPEDPDKYFVFTKSKEWKPYKNRVEERSGGLCERCDDGITPATVVHHKLYYRRYHPRLRDLEHLCKACHEEELKYLSAERERDVELIRGREGRVVTIKAVLREKLKSGRGNNKGEVESIPILFFSEITKGLVVRPSNGNAPIIERLFGTPENGIGKKVRLCIRDATDHTIYDARKKEYRKMPIIRIFGVDEIS